MALEASKIQNNRSFIWLFQMMEIFIYFSTFKVKLNMEYSHSILLQEFVINFFRDGYIKSEEEQFTIIQK